MYTNIVSASILALILWGRSYHNKCRKTHIRLMGLAMTLDILLVLFLVFGKRVLPKVQTHFSPLLGIHIFMALSVVVLYFMALRYGIKIIKGFEKEYRPKMRKLDRVFIPLRVGTLVTSLMLVYL